MLLDRPTLFHYATPKVGHLPRALTMGASDREWRLAGAGDGGHLTGGK